MSVNKCCATCDRAAQLYVGDTPTVYRFCQLSDAIPHLPHEYCEDYIPKNKEKKYHDNTTSFPTEPPFNYYGEEPVG